jgi:hypothetical protein
VLIVGYEHKLDDVMKDVEALRHLSGGQAKLSVKLQVEWTRLLLWRIGQSVESYSLLVRTDTQDVSGAAALWDGVASMADHRQPGQALQRMYQSLKEKGYQAPASIGGRSDLIVTTGELGGALLGRVSPNRDTCWERLPDLTATTDEGCHCRGLFDPGGVQIMTCLWPTGGMKSSNLQSRSRAGPTPVHIQQGASILERQRTSPTVCLLKCLESEFAAFAGRRALSCV